MCDFLSFVVETGKKGLRILAAPDLVSHTNIQHWYHFKWRFVYEVEWIGRGNISVRVPPAMSDNSKDEIVAWIQKNYPSRDSLVKALLARWSYKKRSLNLSNSTADWLPSDFHVQSLNIRDTMFENLPTGLVCDRLYMNSRPRFNKLPEDLKAGKVIVHGHGSQVEIQLKEIGYEFTGKTYQSGRIYTKSGLTVKDGEVISEGEIDASTNLL